MPSLTVVPHGDAAAVVLPAALLELLGTGIGGVLEATPGDRELILRATGDAERIQAIASEVLERRQDAYRRLA